MIPTIKGTIARRMLVNYRADPATVQALLPAPFRPQCHEGSAVVGVCLIRLEKIRPVALAFVPGLSSENAAHRFAVTWDEGGVERSGVYIPRRDTNSVLNTLAGGRLVPGEHHRADFTVHDSGDRIEFRMRARDGEVTVHIKGHTALGLPVDSCFASLQAASAFFAAGSLGFSPRHNTTQLDGLRLDVPHWRVEPLELHEYYSSFFADEARFPAGSVTFDHALLMRQIEHQWHRAACPVTA